MQTLWVMLRSFWKVFWCGGWGRLGGSSLNNQQATLGWGRDVWVEPRWGSVLSRQSGYDSHYLSFCPSSAWFLSQMNLFLKKCILRAMGSQWIIWARGFILVQLFRITNHIPCMIFLYQSFDIRYLKMAEGGPPLSSEISSPAPNSSQSYGSSIASYSEDVWMFRNVILNTWVWRILRGKSCGYILKGKDLRLFLEIRKEVL